jgi:site-specific DNA-adenine methylase
MAKYGIPYMGSKEGIADLICNFLPSAENFYDLFGGGFSITHCMLLAFPKKYKHLHFNEFNADTVQLIKDAIAGKYNYDNFKPPWIDRETFMRNKDKCAYTRIVWSFGNNQKAYIFGKEIEKDKRSLHNAVVFNEFDNNAVSILGIKSFQENLSIKKRRLLCRQIVCSKMKRIDLEQLERLERLERLEQLERLERLQQLEQLERLELTSGSYDQVKIKPNSLVYCDPPYKGTAEYTNTFNHDKFYDWLRAQTQPVFISEYTMPTDFDIAFSVTKGSTLSGKGHTASKAEKLFVNKAGKELLLKLGKRTFENK